MLVATKRSLRDLSSSGAKPGSAKATRAPPSGESSTQIRPPCASTIERAMPRPRPLPPDARSRDALAAVEAVEDPLALRGGDARAVVVDRDHQPLAAARAESMTRPPGPAWRRRWRAGCGRPGRSGRGRRGALPRPARRPRRSAGRRRRARAGSGPASTSRERGPDALVEAGEGEQVVDQPLDPPHLGHRHPPRPGAPPRRSGSPRGPAPRAGRGSRSAGCAARARRRRRTAAAGRRRRRGGRACG